MGENLGGQYQPAVECNMFKLLLESIDFIFSILQFPEPKYLLIDIYNLLVDESKAYYLNFGSTDAEAKILSVFVVQTYGNHEDFTNYLIVNKDRFNLGRNCFLSKIKLKNPFHLFSIYSIVNKIVHFNLKLLVREIFMYFVSIQLERVLKS